MIVKKTTKYIIFEKWIYSNIYLKIAKSGYRIVPNIDVVRNHFLREGLLSKPDLVEILKEVIGLFCKFIKIYLKIIFLRNWAKRDKNEGTRDNNRRYPWIVLWYDTHVWKSYWL